MFALFQRVQPDPCHLGSGMSAHSAGNWLARNFLELGPGLPRAHCAYTHAELLHLLRQTLRENQIERFGGCVGGLVGDSLK